VLNNPSVAPWKAAATDSFGVTNGQTGKISFNVTADVQMFLADTANFGWVVKPKNDAATGDVRLLSRETVSSPTLVLIVDVDTSRPVVPDGFAAPDSAEALLVTQPGGDPTVLVLRDFVHIQFDDTTSGQSIKELLALYGAQVAGGYPLTHTYIIRVPDPGPTYAALEALMERLRAEPGVRYVYRLVFQAPEEPLGRYPNDGPLAARADWLGTETDATRALRAIRADCLSLGARGASFGPCPRSPGSSASLSRCTMTTIRRPTSTCGTASTGLYWGLSPWRCWPAVCHRAPWGS
jgi:hypothetical protein